MDAPLIPMLPLLALIVLVSGCDNEPVDVSPEPGARPQRIASIDFCADQYVLKLVER